MQHGMIVALQKHYKRTTIRFCLIHIYNKARHTSWRASFYFFSNSQRYRINSIKSDRQYLVLFARSLSDRIISTDKNNRFGTKFPSSDMLFTDFPNSAKSQISPMVMPGNLSSIRFFIMWAFILIGDTYMKHLQTKYVQRFLFFLFFFENIVQHLSVCRIHLV